MQLINNFLSIVCLKWIEIESTTINFDFKHFDGLRVYCRHSSKEIFYLLLSVFFDLKASFSGNFWVIIMKTTSSIIWSLLEVNQTLKKPLGENSFILNYYQTLISSAHIYNGIFSKFAYYLNNLSKSSHFMIYQKSKKIQILIFAYL